MFITAQQIRISLAKESQSPTADEMTRQFLTEWRLEFKITIGFGIYLLLLEAFQLYRSVLWYLRYDGESLLLCDTLFGYQS
jgi:hypothetical protein